MSDGGASSGGNDRELFAARPAERSRRGLDELLPAVVIGDQGAYETLYDQASGWVLGVVRKVLRDPAQAEEVMQEVLLEVWRTASVAAVSCVAANTASTAAIVLGEDAPRWLESAGVVARLVRPDGRVVITGGWPAQEELPCAA